MAAISEDEDTDYCDIGEFLVVPYATNSDPSNIPNLMLRSNIPALEIPSGALNLLPQYMQIISKLN